MNYVIVTLEPNLKCIVHSNYKLPFEHLLPKTNTEVKELKVDKIKLKKNIRKEAQYICSVEFLTFIWTACLQATSWLLPFIIWCKFCTKEAMLNLLV